MEKSIHRLPIYICMYGEFDIFLFLFYVFLSFFFEKGFNVSLIYLNSGVFLKNINTSKGGINKRSFRII